MKGNHNQNKTSLANLQRLLTVINLRKRLISKQERYDQEKDIRKIVIVVSIYQNSVVKIPTHQQLKNTQALIGTEQ